MVGVTVIVIVAVVVIVIVVAVVVVVLLWPHQRQLIAGLREEATCEIATTEDAEDTGDLRFNLGVVASLRGVSSASVRDQEASRSMVQ
jgi:hypothetical protein